MAQILANVQLPDRSTRRLWVTEPLPRLRLPVPRRDVLTDTLRGLHLDATPWPDLTYGQLVMSLVHYDPVRQEAWYA